MYWFQSDYNAMQPRSALLLFVGALIAIFLTIWTPMVLVALFQLLVQSAVESDQRVVARVRSTAKRAATIWGFICTAIVLALLGDPLKYTLGQL
jgi:hypothetical protein